MDNELKDQMPGVAVPAGAQVPGTNLEQGEPVQTITPEVAAEVAAAELSDETVPGSVDVIVEEAPQVADPEHSAPAIDPMVPVGPN